MRRFVVFSAALVIGFGAIGLAQTPQVSAPLPGQPARPQTPARPGRPGEPPPKGTAIIRGTVVAADTGQPLRKVQIRAMAMTPGVGSGGISSTDAEGKFEIKELVGGRYNLSASKGVYVTMQYGARRAGDQGTPIEIADGQIAEKVNFTLSRGGVISGRIVDEFGEPMAGVNVTAQMFRFMSGSRRLMPVGGGDRTDDTGSYRLYGLAAGEYYVNASGGMGLGGPNIVINGAMLTNTDTDGYAPTYYPGTPNIAEAQRVSLKAGQELTAVHFSIAPTRLSRVRGRVLNSRGEPARGMVMLMPSDLMGGFAFGPNSTSQLTADGSFQLNTVAPGRYNLNVRPMGMPGPDQEFAVMPLTVGPEDLDNLMITTSVGATATGVIQTDDGSPPPFRADEVQVFASTIDPMVGALGGGPPKINADFSFELSGMFDRRIIRASVMNQFSWSMKAVYFDGNDVTDTGIEFTPGRSYEGLQVVFTQKVTELQGQVSDSRGRPITDATVVIFPSNREKWVGQSRYMRTTRPDTQGRYNFRGLPPHDDYMIIAVQNLESGQGADPDFLTRAREEGKSLSLSEGEKKAFDIRLSTLVP